MLKDKVRRVKLEAERHENLAERQRASRAARSYCDELGMVHVHLALEPHVGTPIVNRAEAEAARLHRAAKGTAPQNPSNATSPTPTPRCSLLLGQAAAAAPKSSFS